MLPEVLAGKFAAKMRSLQPGRNVSRGWYYLVDCEKAPMLNTSKLVAFVPIRDSDRSRPFYEEVLGLRFITENPFALLMDSNGVRVRLAKTPKFTPAGFTVLGWEVTDIQTMVTALMQKGVNFERFPGMEQDELGIWAAPSGAKVAWFKDPDGNILSLAQHP